MAHTTDPAAIVVDQETLIQGVAKHFVQKVFGLEGMPWGTKFSDLEELAVQIGQAVSRSMMDQALAGQAQAGPAVAPVCGVCGTTVQAGSPGEPRAVTTTVGTVDWIEPKRYCPTCRAAFFSLSPRVWGLTTAATALRSKSRSSTPGSRTPRLPRAGMICSIWPA